MTRRNDSFKNAVKLLIGLAIGSTGTQASATVFIETFEFQAVSTGLIPLHSGDFTIQYDDATNAATLLGINFEIGTTVFTTANTGLEYGGNNVALGQSYYIGGLAFSPTGISSNTNDFLLHFNPYTRTAGAFYYSTVGLNEIPSGTATLAIATAVPEPATWAMMLLGFGAVGIAMRRRRSPRASRQLA